MTMAQIPSSSLEKIPGEAAVVVVLVVVVVAGE